MAEKNTGSHDSLMNATRSRASFSGHGKALGAAGHREISFHPDNCSVLNKPGASIAVNPPPESFGEILIGGMWDVQRRAETNVFKKIFKKTRIQHVDLDLGCLYELQDGTRGAIQAFGQKFGAYDEAPHIWLSGDERTGAKDGHDETIHINGTHWSKIKRLLVYMYIYDGAQRWSDIQPQVIVDIPGDQDLALSLSAMQDHLNLCAIGSVENVRGGIRLTNHSEYFPGHLEMDRAFGFGLDWADGQKEG